MSHPVCGKSEFECEWDSIRRRRETAFTIRGRAGGEQDSSASASDSTGASEVRDDAAALSSELSSANRAIAEDGPTEPADKVGLALSGGGLRSALFNEGFLQALSHRGLLRYVDYLCSVSGGGYIAGRLLTNLPQDPDAVSKQSFHHEGSDENPDWQLGRDPASGKERDSMPQVGSYLSRSHLFAASYVLRQLPVWVMYLSLAGIFATLLALLFRSYDSWLFRGIYENMLMVRAGGELLVAFIPTLIVATLTLTLGILYKVWEYVSPQYRQPPRQMLGRACQLLLFITALFAFTSLAVFMGNGLTSASAGADQDWNLNYFATYMAIIAGTVQILVFLGRDKLFRSERSESSHWEKMVQGLVSYGVLGFLVFAMVHWMSREDISQYTSRRDPYLVAGEVMDWEHLQHIFSEVEKLREPRLPLLAGTEAGRANAQKAEPPMEAANPSLDVRTLRKLGLEQVQGFSEAERYWRFSFAGSEHAYPDAPLVDEPSNLEPMSAWQRMWTLTQICLQAPGLTTEFENTQGFTRDIAANPPQLGGKDSPKIDLTELDKLKSLVRDTRQRQLQYLSRKNPLLNSREMAEYLISEIVESVAASQSADADSPGSNDAPTIESPSASESSGPAEKLNVKLVKGYGDEFLDLPIVQQRLSGWPENRRHAFESCLHRFVNRELFRDSAADVLLARQQGGSAEAEASSTNLSDKQLTAKIVEEAKFNRDLLELVNRNLLKEYHIASTPVVQVHDQLARVRWLITWLVLFGLSLVLTANLDRLSALFIFYRSALASNFLSPRDKRCIDGETPLAEIRPEEYGLPYPIFLAAWLKLDSRFGNFVRRACAFTMTPREVHLRDGDAFHEDTAQYSRRQPLALADAVATSGAAVTPQMTENPALAVLMDLLGMRLGMWMKLPGSKSDDEVASRDLIGLVAFLAVGFGIFHFAGLLWSLIFAAIGLTGLLLIATGSGYPGFVCSMLKQATLKFRPAVREEPEAIARCWSKIFVADGGFYDFLGVTELLRRRCELIVVSDAGVNTGKTTLESLARMCESATAELGVRFLNLDHEGPIDFVRLRKTDEQYSPQPYLAMRVRYPEPEREDGLLFYVQMAIVADDPVEIQQIRYRFPSFPDEPTTNQFYTEEQVAAYRHLGYHIGKRLCRLLERWDTAQFAERVENFEGKSDAFPNRQPFFGEIKRRLCRGYLQTCYEEYFYDVDDVYAESVWRNRSPHELEYPTLRQSCDAIEEFAANHRDQHRVVERWLHQFCHNRDVMLGYMDCIDADINVTRRIDVGQAIEVQPSLTFDRLGRHLERSKAGHYAALAMAADQLHHGVSPRAFQVGGRQKLVDLMVSLEQSLKTIELKAMPFGFADAVVHEIAELKDCVFQTGSHVSTVSFAQCLCLDFCNSLNSTSGFEKNFQEDCQAFLARPSQVEHPRFDLALDFRRLFMDALLADHRSRLRDILAHYLAYLAVLPDECPYDPGTELTFVKLADNGRSVRLP